MFVMGRMEGLYNYIKDKGMDLKNPIWQASAVISKSANHVNPTPYVPLLEYLENEFDHINDLDAIEEFEKRIKKFLSAKQVWVHFGRSTL